MAILTAGSTYVFEIQASPQNCDVNNGYEISETENKYFIYNIICHFI